MKSLNLSLDFRSGIPSYIQIVEQVQVLLSTGVLQQGDQLPTVRQLAAELRVNFNTIARAYRMLDDAGLISTQQGRGTYILESLGENQKEYLKKNTLDPQIERFLTLLKKQGYQPEEIEKQLKVSLKSMRDGTLHDTLET